MYFLLFDLLLVVELVFFELLKNIIEVFLFFKLGNVLLVLIFNCFFSLF